MIRGLVVGLAGTVVGMALTMLVRLALGLPAWKAGPVTAVGSVVGIICYLGGLGAFRYWLASIRGRAEEELGAVKPPQPHWMRYFSFDTNHKTIGIQYLVTSFLVISVAGIYQLIARLETAQPGLQFLNPNTYNSLISLHGIMSLGGVLLGIAGMMNYLVPLMIGARDMAFPRLNALSYWLIPPAVLLFLFSLPAGGFDTGWTAYPPLSLRAPLGMQFMLLAFYLVGWSSILGSINFLATIFKMRAPGMSFFRMPIFIWATIATAILQLIFTQFVGIAFLLLLLERLTGMGFFDPDKGGNVILYQHLFWFYSHPAVYIFVLPGLGVISEVVPVFSRKPLFGYQAVAISSLAIAFGGTIVWGHHMFAAGMEEWLRVPMMFTTLLVAVPTGVKIFSWLTTMWFGKIHLETPMLFVISAIAVFVIGGITGVVQGIVPVDLYLTDTYWVVAHFHSTLFGGFVFPIMAAIHFWFPKVTGRLLNERLGKSYWAVITIGFLVTYLPMFWLGLNGMRRRIADYDPAMGLGTMNTVATIGGYLIGFAMLLFLLNLVVSARRGARAPANPWQSQTLEWQVSSPPPEENFPTLPQVVGTPYGYGIPGSRHALITAPTQPSQEVS
ncbi:MAG: cbb3-type cytochrome c oxidase subunit I [Chloroflexi bacterium]|nr:cbb3-type cytochrome c oxidase subunit I [Chloroflexota bacterium]